MKKFVLIFIGILCFNFIYAQQYIVSFSIQKDRPIPDYVSIDKVEGNYVTAYIWGKEKFLEFKRLYPDAVLLPSPGKGKAIIMAQNFSDMENWDKYPTYDLYVDMMRSYAEKYPYLVRLDTIGYSQQGRLLLAVKITDNPDKEEFEPQFFYTSSMHGDELTGYVILLHLIDYLLNNYNKDSLITYLINNYEIYINPLANPDGAYHGGDNTVAGAIRYYADGQDPNRDFFPVPGYASTQGRIETEAMKQYAAEHNFIMSVNIHGGSEVYNYPWDIWTSSENAHADDAWFRAVGERYVDTARKQDDSYMTDVTNSGVTEGGDWYVVAGSRQDYMNFVRHCKEATLEISSTKLVSSDQLPYFWNLNYKSLIYYIFEAEKGLQGIVLDSADNGITAKLFLVDYDKDSSEVYSFGGNGRYFRPLLSGTYHVRLSDNNANLLMDTTITIEQGRNFLNIIPAYQEHVVTVKVINDSMKPLANVEIRVLPTDKTYFTDVYGIDTLHLYTGVYELHIIDTALNYHQVFFESIIKDDTLRYMLPSKVESLLVNKPSQSEVKIFPQPAHLFVNVQADSMKEIEIYSITGQKFLSLNVNNSIERISLSGLKPGIYIVRISLGDSYVIRRLLVN